MNDTTLSNLALWIFKYFVQILLNVIKLSGHSSSMWDKLWWINWFWQFLCEGLSSFLKDSITHMHGLMHSFWFYFIHLLMCLSLKILTSIIGTGQPILVELIDLVNFVIICLSQIILPIWLISLLDPCDSHSATILDLCLSSDAGICSTMTFPPTGNSDNVSVSIGFPPNSKRDAPCHSQVYDYFRADWDGLCDHLRDVRWKVIIKLSAFAAAREFCQWVQVEIDVYAPHHIRSSLTDLFSAACVAVVVHFFGLYQKHKSSESKVKFRQASNRCKRVLEAAKLAYANKTKESIASKNLGSWNFRRIAKLTIVFSTKVNLLYTSIQRPGGLIFCIWWSKIDCSKLSKNLDDFGVSLPVFLCYLK